MARGRKPKPVELREAEGNPGRRPLPPALRTGDGLAQVEPPERLGAAGAELWRDMTERLLSAGALDTVDLTALEAMCIQWDRACEAGEVVRQQGYFARGSMGQMVEHPALKIERAAHAQFLKYAAEYAATPVARTRVAAARDAREREREFDELTDGEAVEIEDAEEIDGDVL